MFRFIVNVIIILALFVSSVQAAPKTKKKKMPTAADYNTSVETDNSLKQIDITADRLPKNYYGNNADAVYSSLVKEEKKEVKGEFETTEQFLKRVENKKPAPFYGSIQKNGLYAFKEENTSIKYDADLSLFQIGISFYYIKTGYQSEGNANFNAKSINSTNEKTYHKYNASNSYGASTMVTEVITRRTNIAFSNYAEFFKNDICIKATLEEAKSTKEHIKVLFIGELESPFFSSTFDHDKPTMDSPTEITTTNNYIYLKLIEVWIYNQKTGLILKKIKPDQPTVTSSDEKGKSL
jgi:hypothetical protein